MAHRGCPKAATSRSLLYRGHVGEAAGMFFDTPGTPPPHMVEAALLSPSPPESAGPVFRRMVADPSVPSIVTLPWWTALRDTAAIRQLERKGDSLARSHPQRAHRARAAYASEAARAYLALLGGDTTEAIRRLEALPDSLCPFCYFERLTLAQLLSARGEDRKALRLMDRSLIDLLAPSEILWTLERARVAERLGEREKAAGDYQYVAGVWRHADPQLQPYVAEAQGGARADCRRASRLINRGCPIASSAPAPPAWQRPASSRPARSPSKLSNASGTSVASGMPPCPIARSTAPPI